MKKGDSLPLYVGNVQVGVAEVTDVQHDRITVITPALKSVIGVRMELTDDSGPREEPGKETIVTGVDRPSNLEAPVTSEDIPAAADAAPAADTAVSEPAPTPAPAPAPVAEGSAAEAQPTPAASSASGNE